MITVVVNEQEHPPGLCLPHGRALGQEAVHGGGARREDPGHRGAGTHRQGSGHQDAVLRDEGR